MSDIDPDSADARIQASLDAGLPVPEDADAMAYRQLYQQLKRSDARLPTYFAAAVMYRILERRLARGESASSLLSIGVGVFAFLSAHLALSLLASLGYIAEQGWLVAWVGPMSGTSMMAGVCLLGLFAVDALFGRRKPT